MDSIHLEATTSTPETHLDASTGRIQLIGRSIPEHSNMFYRPLIDWVKEYGNNPAPQTTLEVSLDYFNSSSHKFIVELMENIAKISADGHKGLVKWYYEEDDDEMKEVAEEMDDNINIEFEIIAVDEF